VLATDPVLLVEDNDDLREALARVLVGRGYRVVQTRDGQEAWDYLERGSRASVIVLDLVLPRMNGRLFRAKQLDHEEIAQIPVVVFTATEDGLPDVVAVVRKTDPETLLRTIEQAVRVPALQD